MTIGELNAMTSESARSVLLECCGSRAWSRAMTDCRPFGDLAAALLSGEEIWWRLDRADWLEAFRAHPQIGETRAVSQWSAQEQAGMSNAGQSIAVELADANREYLSRFGYIFIVCATGKSASEMLAILKSRLTNAPGDEVRIAAEEQSKISALRLKKLLT